MRPIREQSDFLAAALAADPAEQRRRRLFECGEVVACNGDQAEVRVGYDGAGDPLVLEGVHVIAGYRPAVGAWVALRYLNGRPGEPIIVGPALTARDAADLLQSPEEVEAARISTGFGIFPTLQGRLEAAEGALLAEFGAESGHHHTGATGEGPRLAQAATHEEADTDSAPGALHHTLGTGPGQAAAGDHGHDGVHPRAHALTSGLDHTGFLWTASRHNPWWLLEAGLERLLQGRLDSKSGIAEQVSYTALANTGLWRWNPASGSWTATASSLYSSTPGAEARFDLHAPGGTVILDRGAVSTNADGAIKVYLDDPDHAGTPHGLWDQRAGGSQTYTLSGLTPGVHSICCLRDNNADSDRLYLGQITLPRLPYQGVGVAGDTFTLLFGLPYLLVHSLGIGPARACAINALVYAPALSPRLPQCSANNDLALAGGAVFPAGWTNTAGNQPMARLPITGQGFQFISQFPPLVTGEQLCLTANAATRGRRVTAADGTLRALTAPVLGSAIVHDDVWAALVRVDTPGAGSAFSAGEVAMLVITYTTAPAGTGVQIQANDNLNCAGDLFRLPSDLL